jgi:ABC-type phosphate transport system substrate-binding protein
MIRDGLGDVAFTSYAPTASDAITSPDLAHFPFVASPFSAVYNLPGISTLVVDRVVLAKIFIGNITVWDHPMLVKLNPSLTLPSNPIEVVLLVEPQTYVKEFTKTSSLADQQFNKLVGSTSFPTWPTSNYTKYAWVTGNTGPASHVNDHPYSVAMSMTVVANQLGATSANMINAAGYLISPGFDATQHAFEETAVQAKAGAQGKILYSWTGTLSNAPGPGSWPLVIFCGITLPRTYSRQSCHARSEMVKWLRWMVQSDLTEEQFGRSELTVFITPKIDEQLGLTEFLRNQVLCEDALVNTGDVRSITLGGMDIRTSGKAISRDLVMAAYSQEVEWTNLPESESINSIGEPDREAGEPDAAWVLPRTFLEGGGLRAFDEESGEFSEERTQRINANTLYFPIGVYSIAIKYTLPPGVLAILNPPSQSILFPTKPTALPLQADLETLAMVFTGEITKWTDARLASINPGLFAAFNRTREDDSITLILFGDGSSKQSSTSGSGTAHRSNDAHREVVSTMFHSLLKDTAAFKRLASSTGISWPAPEAADWSPVFNRSSLLTGTGDSAATPLRFRLIDIEDQLDEVISSVTGSVGIVVLTSPSPSLSMFDLLRPVPAETPITVTTDTQVIQTASPGNGGIVMDSPLAAGGRVSRVSPSVVNQRACLSFAAALFSASHPELREESITAAYDADAAEERARLLNSFSIDPILFSPDAAHASCYPLSFLMDLVVARDALVHADAHLPANSNAFFCQRGEKIAKVVEWLAGHEWKAWASSGVASAMSVPLLKEQYKWRANMLTCAGEPIAWTRSAVWHVPMQLQSVAEAIAITGGILVFVVLMMIVKYRSYAIIRTGRPLFQIVTALGVLFLLSAMVLLSVDQPGPSTCSGLIWTLCLGYSFAIGAPCIKVWYAWRGASLVAKRQIQRSQISYVKVLRVSAMIGGSFDWVLLGIAQSKAGGMLTPKHTSVDVNGVQTVYTTCTLSSEVIPEAAILFSAKAILLFSGCLFAFVARHRASAFNEITHLSRAVWNTALSIVLIAPILALLGGEVGSATLVLEIVLLAWLSLSTLAFIFAPKMYLLLTDHLERRKTLAQTQTSVFSSTGGGGTRSAHSKSGLQSDLFSMPNLSLFSLAQLEKYMTALEGQLRLAKDKRLAETGTQWIPGEEGDDEAAARDGNGGDGGAGGSTPRKRARAAAPAENGLGGRLKKYLAGTGGGSTTTTPKGASRRQGTTYRSHRRDLSAGGGPALSGSASYVGNEHPQIDVELVVDAQKQGAPDSVYRSAQPSPTFGGASTSHRSVSPGQMASLTESTGLMSLNLQQTSNAHTVTRVPIRIGLKSSGSGQNTPPIRSPSPVMVGGKANLR